MIDGESFFTAGPVFQIAQSPFSSTTSTGEYLGVTWKPGWQKEPKRPKACKWRKAQSAASKKATRKAQRRARKATKKGGAG